MKLDKFTWAVIGVVLLLLVAAVITVNMTGGEGVESRQYLANDQPEAPVYNAFLALQRGDITKAREQYSQAVLAEFRKDGNYDPLLGRSSSQFGNRRLRILKSEVIEDDPNRALVTYALDSYYEGGFLGSGSTSSYEGTVEVIFEDGGWKLNTQEAFW